MDWNPLTIDQLHRVLPDRASWFLDGGQAFDLFLGEKTREHSDLDIGVFSYHAKAILDIISTKGYRVYIANQQLLPYVSSAFDEKAYNYWVADDSAYKLQILVYQVEGENVVFRRNPLITWPKKSFLIQLDQIAIVNPLVSYAFKVTTKEPLAKDLIDIKNFMDSVTGHE